MFQGTRIDSKLPEQPGDYGLMTDGHWWAKVPQPGFSTGILSGHDITVHKDGTITVSPSILMDMGNGKVWHGYLERGIWREV